MTDYRPGEEEVRVTSETGGQKGQKQARLGGADPLALMELARIYGYGEQKYARYNYLKGYRWSLSVDALLRHLLAFLAGEDRDPESGLLHMAHVAWHGLALTSFTLRRIGEDDRAPRLEPTCWHPECILDGHDGPMHKDRGGAFVAYPAGQEPPVLSAEEAGKAAGDC